MSAADPHDRPEGATDAEVAAVGRLTEALEWVERARGHLYEFHQQMGHADGLLQEAADALEAAGHPAQAAVVRHELVGRNVVEGRWTFQVVEEFDDGYWSCVRSVEHDVRHALLNGRRHVFESELKDREMTPGSPAHRRRPPGS